MEKTEAKKFHNAYVNADEKELDRLWKEVAPKTLIKFFSAEYLPDGKNYSLENISNKKLWLSSPRCFNDPLDCVINIDYQKIGEDISKQVLSFFVGELQTEKIIQSDFYKQTVSKNEEQLCSKMKQTYEKFRDTVYASCLTDAENLCSLSMWAHYAKNHMGFCAEYDFKSVNNSVEFGCIPIFYTNEYSYMLITESVNEGTQNILNFVFTKALDWQNEREWRIAQIKDDLICEGYYINFPLPKRIYIGCRASKKLKNDLMIICEENDIELYQMNLKPGTFTLMYDSII